MRRLLLLPLILFVVLPSYAQVVQVLGRRSTATPWTSAGSFLTANDGTAATTWSPATSAQLDAGDVGVCVVAKDETGGGTTDGDAAQYTSMVDQAANAWIEVGEYCNMNTSTAADGACVAIYYTKATNSLASGALVTFTFSASTTRKAATCWAFNGDSVTVTAGTNGAPYDAADPGSLTVASGSAQEHLFIRASACESNDTGYTADGDYTTFTHTSSTSDSGAADTSMGARAEYRIATESTSAASDPTYVAADCASVAAGFDEAVDSYGDIRLWLAFENNCEDITTPYDCGADDYCAFDTDGVMSTTVGETDPGEAASNGAAKVGSCGFYANGTDFGNTNCVGAADPVACCTGPGAGTCNAERRVFFQTVATPGWIINGGSGSLGMWVRPVDSTNDQVVIMRADSVSGTRFQAVYYGAASTHRFEFEFDDGNNANCTAANVPHDCCTGVGTGDCVTAICQTRASTALLNAWQHVELKWDADTNAQVIKERFDNASCTGFEAPLDCCSGAGTGNCGDFDDVNCTAADTPVACCTGQNNASCTGADAPYDCCTGSGTGACGTGECGLETTTCVDQNFAVLGSETNFAVGVAATGDIANEIHIDNVCTSSSYSRDLGALRNLTTSPR